MLKAALFDMDGTIIKTQHVWDDIIAAVVGRENIYEFRRLRDTVQEIGMKQTCTTLRNHFGATGSDKDIIDDYKRIANNVIHNSAIEFVDGFESFHEKIVALGFKTALVTNAPDYALDPLKEKLGLSKFFGKHMYNSCIVENVFKPNPAVLLYAMARLEVTPDECMIFEDSHRGIQAATRAGIKKIIALKSDEIIQDYNDMRIQS